MRVLIADEQGVMRDALRALLRQEPGIDVVGEAADGPQAALLAERLAPDVLLTEIDLPQLDGLTLVERLKQRQPRLRVVVLSAQDGGETPARAFDAGADAFVSKRASGRELVEALRAAALPPVVVVELSAARRASPLPGANGAQPCRDGLTAREKDVLRLLAIGYTNREAARVLKIGVRTVESHRARLMEKLNIHSRAELVQYAAHIRLVPQLEPGEHPA